MLKEQVNRALQVLQDGGLILYPTDTIWGIGCDATNPEAVDKIITLKGRSDDKSMIILLDSENKLPGYVQEVPEIAYHLIEYAEKPLTIIFSDAKNLASNVVAADGSIGIRIVKHPFCEMLLQRFRKPIVSTSANISGQPSPQSFRDINDAIMEGVDLIIDYEQDQMSENKPSTIMKLEAGGKFSFIRR